MNTTIEEGRDRARPDEEAAVRALGTRLAKFRSERGLTIAELASAADLSSGMISQLERGQRNPSVTTVMKLAAALAVPFTDFFTGDDVDASPAVVTPAARRRLVIAQSEVEYEVLTPHERGRHGVYLTRMAPGWSGASHVLSHEGEETHVVLEGVKVLTIAGHDYRLEVGDSITLDSTQQHWSSNPGDTTTVSVICMSPPGF